MKRIYLNMIILLLIFALLGCARDQSVAENSMESTVQLSTVPTVTETVIEPITVPTEPEHSSLYFSELPVDDAIAYFNEVCLNAEIINSGDPAVIQKWTAPIRYQLHGDYTQEDLSVLSGFCDFLNDLEGFPGISQTDHGEEVNLRIHFCTRDELVQILGDHFGDVDGGVTFWYQDDVIYDAVICIRTDIDQNTRNSVILEEIYNGLGPIQDTDLCENSIIYSGFSTPQDLSAVDRVILELLYHPMITCGMDRNACEAVIRQLYY